MAYTTQDLDSIKKAISQGVKEVRLNNRLYQFQSVSQMLLAKKDIEDELIELGLLTPTVNRPRMLRMVRGC